ncbi:MAG: translation initiation factor [Chloroflexota bacterium]|nr:translation initiation factor [Chloroflexota bacterium]
MRPKEPPQKDNNPFATLRVYSTDPDPNPEPALQLAYPSANKQTARIWRDSKRRRGKTVTVIGGLQHDPATFEELLRTLKKHCGAGGTFKEGEIEIQGDHREVITTKLTQMGYKTKQVGG